MRHIDIADEAAYMKVQNEQSDSTATGTGTQRDAPTPVEGFTTVAQAGAGGPAGKQKPSVNLIPQEPIQEDGSRKAKFAPAAHVRKISGRGGGGDYLDVKWRMKWARDEHPDLQIITEVIQVSDTFAFFKATVSYNQRLANMPEIVACTGHGSETKGDFPDYIEKAETKAIGRALMALGYGLPDMADDARPVDSPVDAPVRQNNGPQRVPPAKQAPAAIPDAAARQRAELKAEVVAQMGRTGALPADAQDLCDEMFGVRDFTKLTIPQLQELVAEFAQVQDGRFNDLRDERAAGVTSG